jgi:hypothetical protein
MNHLTEATKMHTESELRHNPDLAPLSDVHWARAEQSNIDPEADYLVLTNGGEWRDVDLFIWPGIMVQKRLVPTYVRGRPVWIAKITRPAL